MKTMVVSAVMGLCLAFAAGGVSAQDAMKKSDSMAKDGMMKKEMTMQECKDHMAMAKKEGMKKDDAMMKADKTCADMMMKKEPHADPMKK